MSAGQGQPGTDAAPTETRRPSGPLDLSALAAARTIVDTTLLPEQRPRATDSRPRNDEARLERELARRMPGLARTSRETLRERIDNSSKATVSFMLRPWDLLLQPLPCGRYIDRGTGFDAVIHPDGRVEYRDKTGARLTLMRIIPPDETAGATAAGLAFDHAFSKLRGKDPAWREHVDFLARTRPLRELLIERARRRHMELADRRIERELARLLAGGGDRQARHHAVFAVWEECADDEIGDLGRDRIEAYLRERCPPEDECGFDAAELERLNAKRGAKRRFDPYVERHDDSEESDAGTP